MYLKIKNKYIRLYKSRSHKYITRKPDGKGGWIYIYSNKDKKNNMNNIDYNDFKEFGYEKAVQISKTRDKIRNKEKEHSIIYDKNGNEILYKIGTKINVKYTDDEIKKIKGSRLLLHNHSNGDSFSPEDLQLLLKENIQEMRISGQSNKIINNFSLKIVKQIPFIERQDLLAEYNTLYNININSNIPFPAFYAMYDFCKKHGEYFKHERIK